MAALYFTANIDDLALVADTLTTALQVIAAANHRVRLVEFDVSFDGTSATGEPVRFDVLRQTTAIGGSPTTVTLRKTDDSIADSILTTAASSAGGAEPTAGDILYQTRIHPQASKAWAYQQGGPEFIIGGGDRLGFRFRSAPGQTPKVRLYAKFEE